jgi:hypothetical protein
LIPDRIADGGAKTAHLPIKRLERCELLLDNRMLGLSVLQILLILRLEFCSLLGHLLDGRIGEDVRQAH